MLLYSKSLYNSVKGNEIKNVYSAILQVKRCDQRNRMPSRTIIKASTELRRFHIMAVPISFTLCIVA